MNALSEAAGSTMTGITTAITTATADLGAEGLKIITAAVGIGVIFWGGKLLWTKFKSMAK